MQDHSISQGTPNHRQNQNQNRNKLSRVTMPSRNANTIELCPEAVPFTSPFEAETLHNKGAGEHFGDKKG
jgi:hypothetical protein